MKIANQIIETLKKKRGWSESILEQLKNPSVNDLHDPHLLENVDGFIDALHTYHAEGKRLTIIPDYDADGILSGSLLFGALDVLGFTGVQLYEPRTDTGYGMTPTSAKEALERYPDTDVIITTDNGSNAHAGVDYVLGLGLDVLITDHHKATDGDPVSLAVNPNRPTDTYPNKGLSGTAVAWKIMQAYAERYGSERDVKLINLLIVLVGMSTISDVMPLLDENRYFVEQSIIMLQNPGLLKQGSAVEGVYGRVFSGLLALYTICESKGSFKYGFDESTLGFVFGPMLNSPRRMSGSSKQGFDILLSDSYEKAYYAGMTLFKTNDERKSLMRKYNQAYLTPVLTSDDKAEYMIGVVPYRSGLIGLVSGRFTSNFNLPSIVFGHVDLDKTYYDEDLPEWIETVSGSGRSPEWFNLHGALTQMSIDNPEWFKSFGGHNQAAGVAIYAKHYRAFRNRFNECVNERLDELAGEVLLDGASDDPTVWLAYKSTVAQPFDILLAEAWDTQELVTVVDFIDQLKPYGQGFREPAFGTVFSTEDAKVMFMGATKQHVKFTLPNGLVILQWNGAEALRKQLGHLNGPFELSAKGPISVNEFRGKYTVQIISDQIELVS